MRSIATEVVHVQEGEVCDEPKPLTPFPGRSYTGWALRPLPAVGNI